MEDGGNPQVAFMGMLWAFVLGLEGAGSKFSWPPPAGVWVGAGKSGLQ